MKTAIKLVFIYLGLQIAGAVILMIPYSIYCLATGGDTSNMQMAILAPSLFLSNLLMGGYLWKYGYISREKVTWSMVSPFYLGFTTVVALSGIWLLDVLMSFLHLPDMMEDTFDILQSGWIGIIAIAVVGPILEELLFRGAVTKALLRKYSPTKAILLSAFIFGIVHFNPAQVVGAGIIGLLLAWIYYKTASLIPCILIHIINNSLSVYLGLNYPDAENVTQVIGGGAVFHLVLTVLMGVLFVGTFLLMRRTTIAYPWKKEATNVEMNIEQ